MVKEISMREFQRHFHKWKGEKCVVVGRNGDILGEWKPYQEDDSQWEEEGESDDSQSNKGDILDKLRADIARIEGKSRNDSHLGDDDSHNDSQEVIEDIEKCFCVRCGGLAGYIWEGENAEGEWEEMNVCGACIKKFKLNKWRKKI